MNRLKHFTAIVFVAVLLPIMDSVSKSCFGKTMKQVILNDLEKFFEKRAAAIIAEADKERNIVKMVFSVESKNEVLDELERTTVSVKIANAMADFEYAKHEVIPSKRHDGYLHSFTLQIITKSHA